MYLVPDEKLWNGRIDSQTDKKEFRFHQAIECKEINNLNENESAFSLIGFASDEGVRRNKGRIGAAEGPNEIKKSLAKLPYNIGNKRTLDVGTIVCEGRELEKAQAKLGSEINYLFKHNKTPIILGGGHETLYGHYLGVREYIGDKATLGVINIDAHFDMRDDPTPSSGTMFKQILDGDSKAGYLCLGIQKFGNTKGLFDTAHAYGCTYIMEEDITVNQYENTFRMIDEFANKHDYIMLTLCSDVIIAHEAPGVSAPSSFGLEAKVVRDLLRYIVSKDNITSFDISEVNPQLDDNNQTVKLAAHLVAEVLSSFKNNEIKVGEEE